MSKKGKSKGEKAHKPEAKSPEAVAARKDAKAARPITRSSEDQRLITVSRALSDPTRVSILKRIALGEGLCGEVKECLGVSAATLSHHLKELEHAGLIALGREGRFVRATVEKKAWKQYLSLLKDMVA